MAINGPYRVACDKHGYLMCVLILTGVGGAISEGHNNQRRRGDQTRSPGLTTVTKDCASSAPSD